MDSASSYEFLVQVARSVRPRNYIAGGNEDIGREDVNRIDISEILKPVK